MNPEHALIAIGILTAGLIGRFTRRNSGVVIASVTTGALVGFAFALLYRWYAAEATLGLRRVLVAPVAGAAIGLVGALCSYAVTTMLGSGYWLLPLATLIIGWQLGRLVGVFIGLLSWLVVHFVARSLVEREEKGDRRAKFIMSVLAGVLTTLMVNRAFHVINQSFPN